jgi:membrane protein required for colicin V production
MVDWVQFNAADWAILAIIGMSIVLSLWRGFVREAVSLAGWIAAFIVANLFVGEMATLLSQWIVNVTGRYVAAAAVLFVGTLVVVGVLGKMAAQVVRVTGLTVLDRVLGTAFGFTRGLIIVLVLVYLLRHLAPPQNLVWLDQAQLMPHIDILGQWAQHLFLSLQSGQSLGFSS